MSHFRVACVQMNSGADLSANLEQAVTFIRSAHAQGAHFATLPENALLMAPDQQSKFAGSFTEEKDPSLPVLRALARELGIWILIGSHAIRSGRSKLFNRSYLIDSSGGIAARYDKIHLFEAYLPGGETYREGDTVQGGSKAVTAALPWGTLGVSICYDVRFPQLYRHLAQAGAFAFTIPSAFTVPTGSAHWHVLLRARAIESGAFVFAPAQCGTHPAGRKTYGHSLVVAPWGEVLAEAGDTPGVIVADIDPALVLAVRSRVPSLLADRSFS